MKIRRLFDDCEDIPELKVTGRLIHNLDATTDALELHDQQVLRANKADQSIVIYANYDGDAWWLYLNERETELLTFIRYGFRTKQDIEAACISHSLICLLRKMGVEIVTHCNGIGGEYLLLGTFEVVDEVPSNVDHVRDIAPDLIESERYRRSVIKARAKHQNNITDVQVDRVKAADSNSAKS